VTRITLQDGKILLRDGKIGTEEACCCDSCFCPTECLPGFGVRLNFGGRYSVVSDNGPECFFGFGSSRASYRYSASISRNGGFRSKSCAGDDDWGFYDIGVVLSCALVDPDTGRSRWQIVFGFDGESCTEGVLDPPAVEFIALDAYVDGLRCNAEDGHPAAGIITWIKRPQDLFDLDPSDVEIEIFRE